MITELTLMSIVALVTLAASGGALFVSAKVSSAQKDFNISLESFKLELERSLSEKFMTKRDCAMYESMRKELETTYRGVTTGRIDGIEVKIDKEHDTLIIALKDILSAVNLSRGK
jgi:hypothetical protein